MFCSKCRAEIEKDNLSCTKCGTKIADNKINLIIVKTIKLIGTLLILGATVIVLKSISDYNIKQQREEFQRSYQNYNDSKLVDIKNDIGNRLEEYKKQYGE